MTTPFYGLFNNIGEVDYIQSDKPPGWCWRSVGPCKDFSTAKREMIEAMKKLGIITTNAERSRMMDLKFRTANCCYACGNTEPSQKFLPFFAERPERETDQYYCGCYGWD